MVSNCTKHVCHHKRKNCGSYKRLSATLYNGMLREKEILWHHHTLSTFLLFFIFVSECGFLQHVFVTQRAISQGLAASRHPVVNVFGTVRNVPEAPVRLSCQSWAACRGCLGILHWATLHHLQWAHVLLQTPSPRYRHMWWNVIFALHFYDHG